MMKLSSGKEVCPSLWIVGTKDVEISFDLLIGSFGLSISLGVICSGELDVVLEEASQFSGEGTCKLWSSVGYQRIMEAKAFEYMVEEKFGHSHSVYGFRDRKSVV